MKTKNHPNETLIYSKEVPAIALRRISEDKIYSVDKGIRSVEFTKEINAEDKWHIGSCTKSMTSYLIAILIQEGKLSWATPIKDIFRDERFDGKNGDVTVLDLLTHRSGLVEPTEFQSFWESSFNSKEEPRVQRAAFLKLLFQKKSMFFHDEQSSYSNSGYVVLGSIIEKISNQSWENYLDDKIFKSLNMDSCGFGAAQSKLSKVPEQTVGHVVADGILIHQK